MYLVYLHMTYDHSYLLGGRVHVADAVKLAEKARRDEKNKYYSEVYVVYQPDCDFDTDRASDTPRSVQVLSLDIDRYGEFDESEEDQRAPSEAWDAIQIGVGGRQIARRYANCKEMVL